MNFKERVYKFLQGRYGTDDLNRFLLAVLIISAVLQMLSGSYFLNILTLLITILIFFRCLSKNISARSAENRKYLTLTEPLRLWFRNIRGKSDFKVYMCPECRQKLRVPKGKGKIEISCSKCGKKFIKRS